MSGVINLRSVDCPLDQAVEEICVFVLYKVCVWCECVCVCVGSDTIGDKDNVRGVIDL